MTDVDWETWQKILHELKHGTPDTPERIALMRRADAAYAKMQQSKTLGRPEGGR